METGSSEPEIEFEFPANVVEKRTRLEESLMLEYHLLNVPVQYHYAQLIGRHFYFGSEIDSAIKAVREVFVSGEILRKDEALETLSLIVRNLKILKERLDEESTEAEVQEITITSRISYLEDAALEIIPKRKLNDTRVNRAIVDYLLRSGYYGTAEELADRVDIQDLIDIEVFDEPWKLVNMLDDRNDAPATTWSISDQNLKLGEPETIIKFYLTYKKVIQLERAKNNDEAINYIRKYFMPRGDHLPELCKLLDNQYSIRSAQVIIYKEFIVTQQWPGLIDRFKEVFYSVYGMFKEPLLYIYLQAGLSALKTIECNQNNCPIKDPLSNEQFQELARELPYSNKAYSAIFCFNTKELMNEDNPPLALPNGYVYSSKTLEQMASNNGGIITCPRTGFVCNSSDLKVIHMVNMF